MKVLNAKKPMITLSLALILFYPVIAKSSVPPISTMCQGPNPPASCNSKASNDKNKQKIAGIFNKVDWKDMSKAAEKDSFTNQDSSDDDSTPTALSKYFDPTNDNTDDSDDIFSDSNPFGASGSDSDNAFSGDQNVFG